MSHDIQTKSPSLQTSPRKPEQATKMDSYILDIISLQHHRQNEEIRLIDEQFDSLQDAPKTLESDSYFIASLVLTNFFGFGVTFLLMTVLMFSVVPLVLLIFLVFSFLQRFHVGESIYDQLGEKLKQYFQLFLVYFLQTVFFTLLMSPFLLVVSTQIMCICRIQEETDTKVSDSQTSLLLIILIYVFFMFLSIKEIFSALDVIAFFYKMNKGNKVFQFLLRVLPQVIQMTICFFIQYITIYIEASAGDTLSLIQNFAGLAILLEFDNFVVIFLRNVGFQFLFRSLLRILPCGDEIHASMERAKESQKDESSIALKTRDMVLQIDKFFSKKKLFLENVNYEKQKTANEAKENYGESDEGQCDEFFRMFFFASEKEIVKLQIAIQRLLEANEFVVEKQYSLDEGEGKFLAMMKLIVVVAECITIGIVVALGEE